MTDARRKSKVSELTRKISSKSKERKTSRRGSERPKTKLGKADHLRRNGPKGVSTY